jgi:uncharacterized membrane protein YadS
MNTPSSPAASSDPSPPDVVAPSVWYRADDALAIFFGFVLVLVVGALSLVARPSNRVELAQQVAEIKTKLKEIDPKAADQADQRKQLVQQQSKLESQLTPMPIKSWLARPGDWKDNPLAAFTKSNQSIALPLFATMVALLCVFSIGAYFQGRSAGGFALGFVGLFALSLLAYVLAGQEVIKAYNLEYALWAVLLGLLISNTIGTPKWLSAATRTEFYIKTGLVLLGAEVLFNKLLALGLPGIFVAWVVTPIVLVSTYLFGQYVLRIPSKSLNLVISADMSVCGVSAAVATAAACRAKKEELSLAIGLSLIFTVIMMVIMPFIIRFLGMGEVIGGAWIGGTVDSTGAVAAAGELVGSVAKDVAATVKMIQNVLIGVIAFAVAVYWVSFVEKRPENQRPSAYEIWRRFPKFTLGFLAMSLIMSYLQSMGLEGKTLVSSIVDGATKSIREWMFCLAFVSIGLESNFREYTKMLASGKPVVLYLCGQALNLLLTFVMAWLMYEIVFPNAADSLLGK